MMTEDQTHYDVLGVSSGASKDEIRDAYRERLDDVQAEQIRVLEAKKPSESAVTAARREVGRVREAWQVLSDPMQRDRYDTALGNGAGGEELDVVDGEIVDDDEDYEDDVPARRPARKRREPIPPPPMAEGLELATAGRRSLATLIDVITVTAVLAGISSAAYEFIEKDDTALLVASLAFMAIVVAYFSIPTGRTGQTFGQRMTYVMVVDRQSGTLLTRQQLLKRYVYPLPVVLFLGPRGGALIGLMYGLSFLFNRELISLPDRFSGSAVVIARYRPERAA